VTKLGGAGFAGALGKTVYVNLLRIVDITDGNGGRVIFVDKGSVGIRCRRVAVNNRCGRHCS
jgi:hypothetical protein